MLEPENTNVLFPLLQMVFHIRRAFCPKQHLPLDQRIQTVCETFKDETQTKR